MAGFVLDRLFHPGGSLHGLDMTHATAISQCLKSNLVAGGVPVDDARVIYQGIPIERFPVREQLGRLSQPVRLLYTGQLHRYKGVHTLLHAAHHIASTTEISVTLVGAGDADYERELRALAAEGSADVTFMGRVPHDDLPKVYREHDLFVFPSTWQEPFGLTHLEAMASGLPVISTANGGHGEFLRDGENALVFEPEDVDGLAGRIQRLIQDDALRCRLARDGRRHVEDHFTLSRYVTDLESHLVETIRRSRS